jgi:exosortase E/protease (VPEID-CTERM system)
MFVRTAGSIVNPPLALCPSQSSRGWWWTVLFLAELLVLTYWFDFGALAQVDRWWARGLWYAPRMLQIVLAGAAALILLGGVSQLGAPLPAQRCAGYYYLGHLLALAGFALVTHFLLANAAPTPSVLLAWLGLGGAAALLGLACWLPPVCWGGLLRRGWRVGLAALAVGLASYGVGRLLIGNWQGFGRPTLWSAAALLQFVSPEVVYQPEASVLGTPGFVVEIAPACCGYEGMALAALFAGLYLWLFRDLLRFPHALLLVPLGIALAWAANVVRIVALVALGSWLSPAVALGGFHSQAGWLSFLGLSLGLVAVSRQSGLFLKMAPVQDDAGRATAAYLTPFLALLATQLATAALSNGFDWLYPLRLLPAGAALWYFRREYTDLRWTLSLPALGWGVVAFGLWLALDWADPGMAAPPSEAPGTLWLCGRGLGSVVVVPLAEELAFRGYLLRRLQAADFQSVAPGRFTVLSFLLSSALFGALHSRWLAGTLAGMIYALVLYRRRELTDAVLAHAVTNALIAAAVLAAGCWHLWM